MMNTATKSKNLTLLLRASALLSLMLAAVAGALGIEAWNRGVEVSNLKTEVVELSKPCRTAAQVIHLTPDVVEQFRRTGTYRSGNVTLETVPESQLDKYFELKKRLDSRRLKGQN